MELIIYGAGKDGQKAETYFGGRALCFCDKRYDDESFTEKLKKKVISFEDMIERYQKGNSIIIVASYAYQEEMVLQLKLNKVERFFVYNENAVRIINNYFQGYSFYGKGKTMDYSEVLSKKQIKKYEHIAISSVNPALPYLLTEIAFQCYGWNVDYIIDEKGNGSQKYMGIPIVNAKMVFALETIDCLVINGSRAETNIRDMLPDDAGFDIVDIYDVVSILPDVWHPELIKFKNTAKNRRCFVIGNGPSLRIDDLDRLSLNNDISFAVNRIYLTYEKTKWRPTYLCIHDPLSVAYYDAEVNKDESTVFYADYQHALMYRTIPDDGRINRFYCLNQLRSQNNISFPGFSDDITKCVYDGFSVTYVCLQLAAYMGFTEIYLLGVDCTGGKKESDGYTFSPSKHFTDDYFDAEHDNLIRKNHRGFRPDAIHLSYRAAERYSRKHGFRIYNATRGGELEEFERVDFDGLF